MTEPTKGWAVVGPDGQLFLSSVAKGSQGAKEAFCGNFPYLWKGYLRNGYRVIRVTITPEKDDE